MERSSGILLHISSLPSKYHIGSFGSEAYEFVDYLQKAGQKLWQVLPLNQTGFGNSPYQSCASHSYNPFFISIDILKEKGLLTKKEAKSAQGSSEKIDYAFVAQKHFELLRIAFSRFNVNDIKFQKFLKEKRYYDYALFMALKTYNNNSAFYTWGEGLKRHYKRNLQRFEKSHKQEVLFWQFVQYEAETQWLNLKKYANERGISIIGDMPLYVALDSVDVWVNPSLFKLDSNLVPTHVAGVPPDYFSKTGQLWGNPVYNYGYHKRHNFSWWVERLTIALNAYDYVRIDHFRGLDRYFEIPNGAVDATVGEWVSVPSFSMFKQIDKYIGKDRIIAEDLGIIDDGVIRLLKHTGYPGMKILCFAFNGESKNPYLPENLKKNSVCYTGTHDNDTLIGFIRSQSEWDYNNLQRGVQNSLRKLRLKKDTTNEYDLAEAIIKLGFKSKANTFIIPMQDVLFLGTEYRMNTPGTLNNDNWAVRFNKKQFSRMSAKFLRTLTTRYDR